MTQLQSQFDLVDTPMEEALQEANALLPSVRKANYITSIHPTGADDMPEEGPGVMVKPVGGDDFGVAFITPTGAITPS